MKKQIIALLFFICTAAGLAAETGYRGHEWYSLSSAFPRTGREKIEQPGWMKTIIYTKEILGEPTCLFFGFSFDYEELINAGYIISEGKTTELKNQLKGKKKKEVKINLGDFSNLDKQIEEAKRTDEEYASYGEKEEKHFYFDQFSWLVQMLEEYGTADIEDNPNAVLTIYDYNNDTRLYLFERAIKGKIVVVYVPHEQDY
jgi:hypothetical protein